MVSGHNLIQFNLTNLLNTNEINNSSKKSVLLKSKLILFYYVLLYWL